MKRSLPVRQYISYSVWNLCIFVLALASLANTDVTTGHKSKGSLGVLAREGSHKKGGCVKLTIGSRVAMSFWIFIASQQCLNVVADVKHSEGRLKAQLSLACGYTTVMFCLFDRSKVERFAILVANLNPDRIAVQDCSPLEKYFLSLCFHFGVVLWVSTGKIC